MGDSSQDLSIEDLWYRYSEGLRWLAASLVSDKTQIEDLVNQTFLEAQRKRPRSTGSLFSWLATVLRNRALREQRRRERAARRELRCALRDRVDSLSPAELVEHAETYRSILDAIEELPEEYGSVLLMRFIQGKRAEEIAKVLGCTPSTVRSRIARGRARLSAKLDAKMPGWKHDFLALLGIDLTALFGRLETLPEAAPAAVSGSRALKATLGTLFVGGVLGSILLWMGADGAAAVGEASDGGPELLAANAPSVEPGSSGGDAAQSLAARQGGERAARRDADPAGADQVSQTAAEETVLFVRFVTQDGRSFAEVAEQNPLLQSIRLYPIVTESAPPAEYPPTELEDISVVGHGTFHRRVQGRGALARPNERNRGLQESIPEGFDGYVVVDPAAGPRPYVSPFLGSLLCGDPVRVDLETEYVTLTVDPAWIERHLGSLRVSFVDAGSGEPIEGLQVTLQSTRGIQRSGATDQKGAVELTGVIPGQVILFGAHPDYEGIRRAVPIGAGPSPRVEAFALASRRTASGRVLDPDGQPVRQARVSAYRLGSEPFPDNTAIPLFSPPTDAQGAFVLDGLGEGAYWLKASPGSGSELCSAGTIVSLGGGPAQGAVIRLPRGIEVILRTEWPHAELRYLAITPTGNPENMLLAQILSGDRELRIRLEPGVPLDFLIADSAGMKGTISSVVVHRPGEVIRLGR